MKRYVFELIIEEGNDEFWESIADKSGCDEILEWMKEILDANAPEYELRLKEFTDK
jgi:hypothetical protein